MHLLHNGAAIGSASNRLYSCTIEHWRLGRLRIRAVCTCIAQDQTKRDIRGQWAEHWAESQSYIKNNFECGSVSHVFISRRYIYICTHWSAAGNSHLLANDFSDSESNQCDWVTLIIFIKYIFLLYITHEVPNVRYMMRYAITIIHFCDILAHVCIYLFHCCRCNSAIMQCMNDTMAYRWRLQYSKDAIFNAITEVCNRNGMYEFSILCIVHKYTACQWEKEKIEKYERRMKRVVYVSVYIRYILLKNVT